MGKLSGKNQGICFTKLSGHPVLKSEVHYFADGSIWVLFTNGSVIWSLKLYHMWIQPRDISACRRGAIYLHYARMD